MNKEDAWAQMTTFTDKDGRRILQFEVTEGPDRGKKYFKGQVSLQVRTSPDPRVPPQTIPFEFDFPEGKTLKWCKSHFDEEADKAIEGWKKEQEKARNEAKNQVVAANGLPPNMLGPDGKPIKKG